MIKKLLLISCCFLSLLSIFAQPNFDLNKGRTCGTQIPSKEWNDWFNAEVAKRNADIKSGKSQPSPWIIPIIVHIIHNGQAIGVGDNISQAQVIDQINTLNADFAGTGLNNGNAPAAFVPINANFQISFCLAVKNPTGGILVEPGIDRIDRNLKGWTAGPYSSGYIDPTIKPSTIWDPTRYCNVWVADLGSGLLGYATFPAGTSLPGIAGGGNATNDGVVVLNTSFGSIGTATAPPYHKGRTLTHELGHWLGLIHTWGDDGGACTGTDNCADTPNSANSVFGCPLSTFTDACLPSAPGPMTMNFMDYTDDLCMFMFTNDQNTRAQTAMTQATFRSLLGTHGLCSIVTATAGPAVASFSLPVKPCVGQAFNPVNTSAGTSPSYSWSSSPNASIVASSTVASPAITFTAPGNYTLTLVVTNTTNTSTFSMTVLNVAKCPKCLDTIRIIKKIDTLITYAAPINSLVSACQTASNTGFLTGTNCYKDKEFAQFYTAGSYSDTPNPQVADVIVLFDSLGTKAALPSTLIYCTLYGGTTGSGPNISIGQTTASLGSIVSFTPKPKSITYCGSPTYTFVNTQIIPYKFTFAVPGIIPLTGFFASVRTPFGSPTDSIRIFSNTKTNLVNDSSSWLLTFGNNWRTLRSNRSAKVQLAILPIVSCRPIVGINENLSEFTSNINIMPNPNNGLFNLVFTLPKEEKINVRIFNSLGQEISNNSLENVTSNVISINISDKPEGIYFVSITNGIQKTVKKVIVSR